MKSSPCSSFVHGLRVHEMTQGVPISLISEALAPKKVRYSSSSSIPATTSDVYLQAFSNMAFNRMLGLTFSIFIFISSLSSLASCFFPRLSNSDCDNGLSTSNSKVGLSLDLYVCVFKYNSPRKQRSTNRCQGVELFYSPFKFKGI